MRINPSSDVECARQRLRKFRGRYKEVARRAKLGYSWVSKFAVREIGDRPGYDFLTRLLKTLDKMEAEAKSARKRAVSMGGAR